MNHVLSLILSFLLFTFITNIPSNNAAPAFVPSQVLDTDGNPITHDEEYFIFPANGNPNSGGLNLSPLTECPLTVAQYGFEVGIPVKFTIPESTNDNILTATNLEIEFVEKPDCAKSSKWLLFVDNSTKQKRVGIGGPENYNGVETFPGKFLIMKYRDESSYTLGFCFDIGGECGPLGLNKFNSEKGVSPLVLRFIDDFPVEFLKIGSLYPDAGDKNGSLNSVAGDKIGNMR
ncbi:kunitz-type trypsin inhibitor-like 1 protein [Vicia villosa]|uniref:kunitz-type trypsin inhibitor-like 1 protein n=1 Tax=Vicia villosa TaxID=3911 RepID=UPI00273B27AF|nr:kunitz-type trypsin inhibitor-like 1 protein [Vicia villosa]